MILILFVIAYGSTRKEMRTNLEIKHDKWTQINLRSSSKKMFPDDDIEVIASKVVKRRKMTFFKEDKGNIILKQIIKKVDLQIYSVLPERLYYSMNDIKYGLSNKEVKELKKTLNKFVDNNLTIPYLSVLSKKAIINRILGVVINSMRKGDKL